MLPDYKTLVYNRLWALAEANPDLIYHVQVGNRQKLIKQAGWLKALFLRSAPADLPSLRISTGRFTNSAFTVDPTFAMESATFVDDGGEWTVTRTAEFIATIVSRLALGEMDPVEESFQIALLKGGPKLGLSYVSTWGPMTATQRQDSTTEGKGSTLLVTTITIPVTMIFEGQALVSPP